MQLADHKSYWDLYEKKECAAMVRKMSKYLDIVRIELQDLINDITEYIETSHKDHANRVIKNFTYHGNLTIYEKQLYGIKETLKLIEELDVSEYETPQELAKVLKEQIKPFFTTRGILEGGYSLTVKRIEGARDYVIKTEKK
jgi:hypothetical protein